MKGMLDFLEKAGLVTKDSLPKTPSGSSVLADGAEPPSTPVSVPYPDASSSNPDLRAGSRPAGESQLKLDDIYANGGVGASLYPAERLLRLVDGLSAMDENTRNMAIRAMDAADESWSIEDPLADAKAKLKALAGYGQRLQADLLKFESQTQARLDALRAHQEKAVADIRKQIAELEALAGREIARHAQQCAEQEAQLKAARDAASRDLFEISQISQRLQGLSAQFSGLSSTPAPAVQV